MNATPSMHIPAPLARCRGVLSHTYPRERWGRPGVFFVSKLAWGLIRPSTILLLLAIVGMGMLLYSRYSRWGERFLRVGLMGLVLTAVAPVGVWLLRPLESRFPSASITASHVDGIILLGGGVDLRQSLRSGAPTLNERSGGFIAFAALARRYPTARLVFTGGSGNLMPGQGSEADVAHEVFGGMGIAEDRVTYERRSRNTRENALYTWRLLHPHAGQTWLLVASAADMPRAVGCFRQLNWPVVPVPVDYHAGAADWFPGVVKGLSNVDWAAHEWTGLLYYRLRGWSASLFPAPQP